MMWPIEDLCLNQRFRQRLRKPLPSGVNVFAEIGMMNEAFPADFQFRSEFAQVRFHDFTIRMHKRVETEDKIDRSIRNHRQRASVIQAAMHVCLTRETFTTRSDAFTRFINSPQ